MPNPVTQFISGLLPRQSQSTTDVVKAERNPIALGAAVLSETSLKDAIGQPHDTDFSILYGLYRFNTDVSGCVHQLAGSTTSPGWRMALMDEDTKPTDKQSTQMKEIARWLNRPNPNKTMTQILLNTVQHMAITGDAFWYVIKDRKGVPVEIWPMHPALTRVVATDEGEVLGYVMRGPNNKTVPFTPEEVVHFQLPNPQSDIYGEGRVELVVEEAGIDLQALRANKAIFINGLSPSALILLDDKATQEDAKALTAMIRQNHEGATNRHKLLALSRVQDFKPYSMTLKDMEFLGLRELSTEKVTTGMGVPKFLLGNHNAGDYASGRFLVRNMEQNVIMPIQDILGEQITEKIIHPINPDLAWVLNAPDSSDPDQLRKDQIEAKKNGILTADEVRQSSFDLEPLEEQDQPATPTKDERSPDEVDDAQNGQNEASPDEVETDDEKKKSITKARQSAEEKLAAERDAQMEALGGTLVDPINAYFDTQEAEYLKALDDQLSESTLDTYLNTSRDAFDSALAFLLGALLLPALTAGVTAGRTQAQAATPDDVDVDDILTMSRTNQIVQGYVNTQSFKQVTGINHTTREALRAELAEGLRKGEGVPELSKRVAKVFDTARSYRTDMIAQTETARAYAYANYETLAALYAQGLVKYRRWITAPDELVCPVCKPLDGVTIPFEAQYPGNIEPGWAHPRCRCSEVGVGDEESK